MIQECCRIVWVWVQLRSMDYAASNCVELTTKDPQCCYLFQPFLLTRLEARGNSEKDFTSPPSILDFSELLTLYLEQNNRSKQRDNKKQSTSSTSIRVVTELSKGCVWVCPVSWLIVFPLSAGQPPPPPTSTWLVHYWTLSLSLCYLDVETEKIIVETDVIISYKKPKVNTKII